MDLAAAQRLVAAADPKAIAQLQQNRASPAVGRAVAGQFGALLLQRVMQNGAGEAIAMTDGPGGNVVNAMYATTMSQALMTGDKLGLADLLYRAMAAKQPSSDGQPPPARTEAAAAPAAAVAAAATGFPLAPYWQGHGMRPLGGAVHGALEAKGSPVAGLVPPPRIAGDAAVFADHAATQTAPTAAHPAPSPATAVAAADRGAPTAGASPGQIRAFSQRLAPLLQRAAAQLGVSPRTLLAQAALETGWGRSIVGNNVFGIKAGGSWSGAGVCATTRETVDGKSVAETATFRAYPSLEAAVADYVSLIANSRRYSAALGRGDDARGYGTALVAGGYATDPGYAAKLAAAAASPSVVAAFAAPPAAQLLAAAR